jgi:hypothetical protein
VAKANPSTLQRIWHNSQTDHRTRGNHHQHYLHNVNSSFAPEAIEPPRREKELTLVLFLDKTPHVTWRDFAKEFNIIIRMKLCHFALRRRFSALSTDQHRSIRRRNTHGRSSRYKIPASLTYKYLHPLVKAIIHDQRMAHANPRRLHAEPTQKKKSTRSRGIVLIIKKWDIRVSRTIVEPSDVRVEEIALHVWGKRGENATCRRSNKKLGQPIPRVSSFPLRSRITPRA